MENPTPLLKLDSKDAELLADWYAIAYDLKHTISSCEALLLEIKKSNPNNTIVRSLWSSALISYIRCFATGRRAKLEASIFANLLGDPLGTHKYFKDTRDKHIAHPVNAFEEIHIGVHIGNLNEAFAIGHLSAFRISDDVAGINNLMQLSIVAIKHVEANTQPLEQKILAELKENPKLLNSLKPLQIRPQGGAETAQKPRD